MNLTWAELIKLAVEFRHELHANPELSWQEVDTAGRIRAMLSKYDISWRECAQTGTVATLAAGTCGEHIALRGDIDALPMDEKNSFDYVSTRAQCMHACGHDGHTATLMAAAIWLKQHEAGLSNPVTLVFQPAEEGGHGAKKMIEEGCLEGVDFIYGWHNWPAIPFGKAVCPDGIVMAGNGTFHIQVNGKGGHSSQPELCLDPVLAASAIVVALQQIVSRRIAPQKIAVVSVTYIEAPSGETTIPDSAQLGGSIRVYDDVMRDEIFHSIKEIAQNIAIAYGVEAIVELKPRYSATVNDPKAAQNMREVLRQNLGEEYHSLINVPIMASEDFSYYLQKIPGAFALIGSDDGGESHDKPCHNVHYDFNDKLIESVSKVFIQLAGLQGEGHEE